MSKTLVKSISLVGFGNIINACLGVLLLTAAAKSLTLTDFGKYALLSSLLVAFSKIMDFGTNSSYVATVLTSTKESEHYTNGLLTLKVLLFGVAIGISTAALTIFNLLSPIIWLTFMLGLVGYGINLTLHPLFHREEQFHFIVLLNMIPALIKGFFAILLLVSVLPHTIELFFGVFSISMLVSAFLYVYSPIKSISIKYRPQEAIEILKQAVSAGISLFISNGFSAVANSITKLIKNFENVGIFSLADKVSNIFSLISLSIFTVLLPKNSLKKKNNIKYELIELVALSTGILMMSAVAAVILPIGLKLIFNDKFLGSIEILNLLIFSSAITAVGSFIESYFFIEKKTHVLAVVSISKLLIFILVSFAVVPVYGVVGLAWSQIGVAILATTTLFTLSLKFH